VRTNHVVEDKVWGKVTHLFQSDYAAVSYLEVQAGFQCSRHIHYWRANQFSVVSGRIIVEEWVGGLLHSINLNPGESYTVISRIPHRFRVKESGVVIEVYWPDRPDGKVLLDDIVRFNVGGVDDGS